MCDIGYLRLRAFNENSSDQLNKEISKLEKKKNLVGYIFDLRNNPGGLLSQAVQILVYEIRVAFLEEQNVDDYWDVDLANNEQTELLINHMDELMQQVEFYDVDNPRKLLLRVRRFFKRSRIDVMETNIFRGLFATIQKKLK